MLVNGETVVKSDCKSESNGMHGGQQRLSRNSSTRKLKKDLSIFQSSFPLIEGIVANSSTCMSQTTRTTASGCDTKAHFAQPLGNRAAITTLYSLMCCGVEYISRVRAWHYVNSSVTLPRPPGLLQRLSEPCRPWLSDSPGVRTTTRPQDRDVGDPSQDHVSG